MKPNASLIAGAGAGAALAYFLDPAYGPRRRARVRDKMAHSAVLTRRAIGTTSRDALHRTYGTAASLAHLARDERVDDEVLIERVRAKLGRLVSHPHALDVLASDGVVKLKGPILKREAKPLLRAIRGVRGVCEVVDALETYEQAGNEPSLQGGTVPVGDRFDLFQDHWSPTTRTLVGAAGVAFALAGAAQRDTAGAVTHVLGLALIARAATNVPMRRLLGVGAGRRAVDLQKTIAIDAPVGEVYAFWTEYENFPHFMSRVLNVRPSERHPRQSHWTVAGPAGMPVSFDAEITRLVPNHEIAWRTVPGSPVAHAGIVRFDHEEDGRTRVHIRMSYNPPAGWVGHGIAAAFGVDPKSSMDADLSRMKTLIETGHAPHDAAQRTVS
jgi:uncharacterized membrane protein